MFCGMWWALRKVDPPRGRRVWFKRHCDGRTAVPDSPHFRRWPPNGRQRSALRCAADTVTLTTTPRGGRPRLKVGGMGAPMRACTLRRHVRRTWTVELRPQQGGTVLHCALCAPRGHVLAASAARPAVLAHLVHHARRDVLPPHLRTCQCHERGCRWHPSCRRAPARNYGTALRRRSASRSTTLRETRQAPEPSPSPHAGTRMDATTSTNGASSGFPAASS
ncbi:hypothetical protein ABID95_007615 [Streptomyces atratus]